MMKKLLSVLTAAVLAMAFALPLNAAPISVPKPDLVRADVLQKVDDDDRRHWRRKHYRHWRGIVTGKGGTHGGTAAMTDVIRVAITAVPTATVSSTRATTVVVQESAFIWSFSCGDILNREEPGRPQ